jgi:dolichol-phosphate mannosyltransferase
MIDVSIIIPCRDEEENVDIIYNNITSKIEVINYQIIFINDFSNDNTKNKIKELSEKDNKVYLYNNLKKGLGGAIELGLNKSSGNYITILMADSADSIDDLNSYVQIMNKEKCDAVFGSRFISGGETIQYPFIKLIFNRFGNNLARLLFLSNYNDFTNSFKIYKKEVIQHFFPLVSEDFNIFLELPLKTISRGFKFKIIPIKYYNRTIGTAKFKIKELGSRYLFTLLYCFIEKILLNKKIK